MQMIEEKLLLYKIITKRDAESYGLLYDRYVQKIYRFVYFKVHNKEDAEDVTSDVFLKAWQYILQKSPLEIQSVSGLLFSIARNSVIDVYRERSKKPAVSIEVIAEIAQEEKSFAQLESKESIHHMVEMIKKLKQDYQEVLLLKYVEELKISEIARLLGKSSVNVRVLLHRALKKLKEMSKKSEKL